MPPDDQPPGLAIDELGSGVQPILGVSTSVTLFVGWARRGPTTTAVRILSWRDYTDKFGDLDADSDLGYAVRHYFLNGGGEALIIRLEAPTTGAVIGPSDPVFQQLVLAQFDAGGRADVADHFAILCVPGLTDQATLVALQARVAARRAFLVADCRSAATAADVADLLPQGPGRENSALYFPWVVATDPLTGVERAFPPSGFVCGVYARTDATSGVWRAPAGLDATFRGVRRLNLTVTHDQNALLNSSAVNCLRDAVPAGPAIWGARTLAGRDDQASDWKYVPVRRLALHIEESMFRGIRWAVFEPNDEPLWAQLRQCLGAFLHGLFTHGAFKGRSPRDAYFVKCDRSTNPAAAIAAGIVTIVVGFAPLKPGEFVTLKIEQCAGLTDA